ncbi:hypothetical protein BJX65DRAFT_305154 [Aspergillus insuetus]
MHEVLLSKQNGRGDLVAAAAGLAAPTYAESRTREALPAQLSFPFGAVHRISVRRRTSWRDLPKANSVPQGDFILYTRIAREIGGSIVETKVISYYQFASWWRK